MVEPSYRTGIVFIVNSLGWILADSITDKKPTGWTLVLMVAWCLWLAHKTYEMDKADQQEKLK